MQEVSQNSLSGTLELMVSIDQNSVTKMTRVYKSFIPKISICTKSRLLSKISIENLE